MMLRQLADLENLDGRKVFLRLDLNVPLDGGQITDDTRIRAALPTLEYLLDKGCKVAVCSHLGRPKGQAKPEYSLEPVGLRLAELLDKEVVFINDYTEEPSSQVVDRLNKNQFILLENLRFHSGEESNDLDFARQLIEGYDFYVSDAFGAMHRAHASTVGAAEIFPPEKRAAGRLVCREVEALMSILKQPQHPYTVVVGGAKVSDKIAVILNLMDHCNTILVGGAMAYTFLKFNGVSVGKSMVEDDQMDLVKAIYRTAQARNVSIKLPIDHVAADSFSREAKPISVPYPDIQSDLMGLDIGPQTVQEYEKVIMSSKTVLWNGPMGVFEWEHYDQGTMNIAKAMTRTMGRVVVGGGDSVAAINKAGVGEQVWHISTGGGASLELLEGKLLPGVKVLLKSET